MFDYRDFLDRNSNNIQTVNMLKLIHDVFGSEESVLNHSKSISIVLNFVPATGGAAEKVDKK